MALAHYAVGTAPLHRIVSRMLATYRSGAVVSTHDLIRRLRRFVGREVMTDEELTELILQASLGRPLFLSFDHLSAARARQPAGT